MAAGPRDAAATGTITGRVTGPDSEPLAGVEVQAYATLGMSFPQSMFNRFPTTRTGFATWTATGPDGTYRLDVEPSSLASICSNSVGFYTLFFSPPRQTGFTPNRYIRHDVDGNRGWLVIEEGQTLTGIDVRLGPLASISGTVTGADGLPLAGASVVARHFTRSGPYDDSPAWRTTTDGRGRYIITNLQDDDYYVEVVPAGGSTTHVYYPGTADPVPIRPRPGENADGYDIVFPPLGSLVVNNAGGHWFEVYGFSSSRDLTAYYTGQSDRVDGLPPGDYAVASVDGLRRTWYPATFQPEDAQPVTVRAGEVTQISLPPAPPGTLGGRVVDGLGIPLEGVEVVAENTALCSTPGSVLSDATGHFSVPVGGDTKVSFAKDGYVTSWLDGKADKESADVRRFRSGETVTLPDVLLQSRGGRGSISGTLTAGGTPLAGLRVEIWPLPEGASASGISMPLPPYNYVSNYPPGTSWRSAPETPALLTVTPAADGSYEAAGLIPGAYLVRFRDASGAGIYGETWYPDATSQATSTPVAVEPGGATTEISADLRPVGSIAGTMTPVGGSFLDNGTPAVCLADLIGNPVICLPGAWLDFSGTYRFDSVSPGAYLVALDWLQAYTTGLWYPGANSVTAAESVVVAPGQTVANVDAGIPGRSFLDVSFISSTGYAGAWSYWVDADTGAVMWGGYPPDPPPSVVYRPPAGRYLVLFDNHYLGQYPVWYPGVSSAADAQVVELLPGQTATLDAVVLEYWRYNHAPVLVDPGAIAATEGAETAATLSADDANGDLLTFSAENLPPGASLDPYTGAFSWTPGCTQAGAYPDIVFTVTDHGDPPRSDSKAVSVSVAGRDCAPVLDPVGARSVIAGETLAFTVTASDPEGDPVVLEAADRPAGANFNAADGTFSWTPDGTQGGVYSVTFAAVFPGDGTLRDEETVTITVLGPLLFQDDFAHADLPADPDWVTAAGAWAVRDGALRSRLAGDAIVLAGPANLAGDRFAAGRLRARVKLGPRAARTPNLKLVFAYRDPQHYRFVRFLPGATEIGQVGEIDGQPPLRVRKERGLAAGRWQGVRVDVHPDGLVRASTGATTLGALKFATPLPGAIGVATRDSQSFVDDFALWSRTVLQ